MPPAPTTPEVVDLGIGSRLVPYDEAWALQRRFHDEVARGVRPDTLILVEHEPVFTAGSRTRPEDLPVDGSPVIEVDRGGRITWHGPGQLVGYPIQRLPHRLDVVAHVRGLEALLIRAIARLGVTGSTVEGRSGVWVDGDKVAAVGVRVARGVTMHGFALNCDCDLSWQDRIVPCGIPDAGVTSLSRIRGTTVTTAAAMQAVVSELSARDAHPTGLRSHA